MRIVELILFGGFDFGVGVVYYVVDVRGFVWNRFVGRKGFWIDVLRFGVGVFVWV